VVGIADIHIGIAGNIGVGKSTLSSTLCKSPCKEMLLSAVGAAREMQILQENVENPYLPLYYKDPKRWAFASQIRFLIHSLEQQKKIADSNEIIIEDRTIHEDVFVFAEALYKQGIMEEMDFQTYMRLFQSTDAIICNPTLLVYLKVNNVNILLERIKKRNRESEKEMKKEYLEMLNEKYHTFFNAYKGEKLEVFAEGDADNDPNFFQKISKRIAERITELRPEQKSLQ